MPLNNGYEQLLDTIQRLGPANIPNFPTREEEPYDMPVGRTVRRDYGPGWDRLNDLPRGFTLGDPPGLYYASAGYITLRERYTVFEGTPGAGQATYAERVRDLMTWAEASGFTLVGAHNIWPTIAGRRLGRPIFNGWFATRTPEDATQHGPVFVLPDPSPCPYCLVEHPSYTFTCPRTLMSIWCPGCGASNVHVTGAILGANTLPCCPSCGHPCCEAGCEAITHATCTRCQHHASHSTCVHCGTVLEWVTGDDAPFLTRAGHFVCLPCTETLCPQCERNDVGRLRWSDHYGGNVCADCVRDVLRNATEIFEEEENVISRITVIPGREQVRNCGVEIEGGNGTMNGNQLAQDFAALGLSTSSRQVQHHSGHAYGFAHVEPDSSVDWEAVIGPINMASTTDVRNLNTAVKAIRDRVRRGELKLDLRCGLHIHVAGRAISLGQAYNLSHLFTYLEDPIFRIGAAKWPLHRSIQGGRQYCTPIPKHGQKLEFFNTRGGHQDEGRNRYYALSFHNYFTAMMRNCTCGAVAAGMWEVCRCELGKCTFEFRLFNTTANMRKLHAYLALCQALVAKATTLPEIEDPNEYPGLMFTGGMIKDMADDEAQHIVDEWKPRLRFMFTELPLTDEERRSLYYCVRNSEIAGYLSERDLNNLTALPENEEVAV